MSIRCKFDIICLVGSLHVTILCNLLLGNLAKTVINDYKRPFLLQNFLAKKQQQFSGTK